MSLEIIETPEKSLNTLLTKTIAIESQARYVVQRRDYELTGSSTNTTGLLTVRFFGVNITSEFAIGDKLWYAQGTAYTGQIVTVTNVIYSAPNTNVVLDIPYSDPGGAAGYVNNLTARVGYNVKVEIRDKDDTFSVFDTDFRYITGSDGELVFDVQGIINSFMKIDTKFSFEYFLRLTEVWVGSDEPSQDTGVLQAVEAFKQIRKEGGSAMWENLLRIGGTEIKSFEYTRENPTQPTQRPQSSDVRAWQDANTSRIYGRLFGSETGSLPVLTFQPDIEDGTTDPTTLAQGFVKYYATVSNFVTAGSYRVDFVGLRADGTVAAIWNNGSVSVNGNSAGYVEASPGGLRAPDGNAEQFVNVGWRVTRSSGDFDLQIEVKLDSGGSAPPYLKWNSYPQAKLLTKFESSPPDSVSEQERYFKFPTQLPTQEATGAVNWTTITTTAWEGTLSPVGATSVLNFLELRTGLSLPSGKSVGAYVEFFYFVSNFVSAGSLRFEILNEAGTTLFTISNISVTGNTGFLPIAVNTNFSLADSATSLRLRVSRVGGGFQCLVSIGTFEIINNDSVIIAKRKFGDTDPLMWRGWNRTVCALVDPEHDTRLGENDFWNFEYADINKRRLGNRFATGLIRSVGVDKKIIPVSSLAPKTNAEYLIAEVIDSGNTKSFSKSIYYKLKNECDNPILLDWINDLGGVDQWLFSHDQPISQAYGAGTVAVRPIIEDYQDVTRTKRRFTGPMRQRLTLRDSGLTFNQVMALREIKKTESLRVYLTKDGTDFIDAIVVNQFDTPMSTRDGLHEFTVQIEFPDDFDFFEAKKY